jgi:protein ImuA
MTTFPLCSLESLREKLAQWEGAFRGPGRGRAAVSSGCGPLDRLLPAGGLLPGTLVEWLAAGDGSGAGTLAALAAKEACRDSGWLVLVDRRREWYPPALLRWGIARETLLVVHPRASSEAAWALDQSLRCPAVGAVLAWIDTLEGKTFRRWQLAAEQSGVLGLLVRPDAARHEPSWADVRLAVEPVAAEPAAAELRRLRIHVLRCRNGAGGTQVEVEIDDETHRVRVAPELAAPEIRARQAEAS